MAKAKVNKKMGQVAVDLPECPVCLDVMSAPIFQCQSGHSICNSCTRILLPPICPICRQPMTQMRNWQLEDFISKATVPCQNKSSGCMYTIVAMSMEDHLKECIFREMACPVGTAFGRCSWSGKLKDILEHFKERHSNHCYMNTETDININNVSILDDERYMYLMPQGKFLFMLTFKIDTCQKMAYWAVQHIGSKKAAQQHVYEVHITSKQDNKRQVIFSDKCFNDTFDVNEVFRQARCGVMPLTMLSHFIKDKKLSFRFNVKKSQPHYKNKERKGYVFATDTKPTNNDSKGPRSHISGNQFKGTSPVSIHFQQEQKRLKDLLMMEKIITNCKMLIEQKQKYVICTLKIKYNKLKQIMTNRT